MTRNSATLALSILGLSACGSQAGSVPGREPAAPAAGSAGMANSVNAAGTTGSAGAPAPLGTAGAGAAGLPSASAGASGAGAVSGAGTSGVGAADGAASAGQGGSPTGSAGAHPSGGASGAAGSASAGSGGASQSCAGRPSLTPGDAKLALQHGGRTRSYLLHVPSGLAAGTAVAVVIDLHGAGGSGSQQKGMSGFSALSDKKKFLAVFPDGVDGYWNVDDTCCGTAGKEKVDDVGFLEAIVSKLRGDTCIDSKRVYVSGFSNGGGLTHRMGCDAAAVIAAIAPMSTDLRTQPCKPARPISMLEIRGLSDSLEPYAGGLVGPAGGQYTAVGAKASLQLWADIDSCTGTKGSFEKYCESYTQCGDGVEAGLCSLPNVDHSPYGNSLPFDVAAVAWSFFERHPMK